MWKTHGFWIRRGMPYVPSARPRVRSLLIPNFGGKESIQNVIERQQEDRADHGADRRPPSDVHPLMTAGFRMVSASIVSPRLPMYQIRARHNAGNSQHLTSSKKTQAPPPHQDRKQKQRLRMESGNAQERCKTKAHIDSNRTRTKILDYRPRKN